ncbi:MAG: FAD-binding domain [Proteobacteria bacterium]|nr:FAD-binding domain [Pseudomonadota bacterium]
MRNGRILISGAGIAGPCLAYWLQRFGFEPVLIERAPALRTGGYIIDFWGLGFDVAEKMGLVPALRRDSCQIDDVRIVDVKGRKTGGFSVRAFSALAKGRYLSILRSDLSRLIFACLGRRTRTMFGDTITGIYQDATGVDVTFQAAPPERFDLVIGAGGLHSPVRRLVFGPREWFEKYLGYYIASFSVENYPRRDAHTYVTYSAPGLQVSRYSLRDGRTVFLLAFASAARLPLPAHDLTAQKDALRRSFRWAGWECREILDALDGCEELYFDSVSQIRMQSWQEGRIALVGDACFCPSLLAGQGSALAMAAAYILAGELARTDGDYRLAFPAYEHLLQPLLVRKQRAAESFARSFVPQTELGILMRNSVTRLMAFAPFARLFMGRFLRDPLTLPNYP